MEYGHIKEFCEKFNYIAENFGNMQEEEYNKSLDFLNVWKLDLAKALMLDFGEDTMFEVSCAIIDLYGE